MFDLWSVLFLISTAQAGFLLPIILLGKWQNAAASYVIGAILLVAAITNCDYLFISTGWFRSFPNIFGSSFGLMLLIGPLFYFYAKSVLDSTFVIDKKSFLHFAPYGINVILNLPLYLLPSEDKVAFIELFVSSNLHLRPVDIVILLIQTLHLSIYLVVVVRLLKLKLSANNSFVISFSERIAWLSSLLVCFSIFLLAVAGLLVYTVHRGLFEKTPNYVFTAILSFLIYFISYRFLLGREVILPSFIRKYQNSNLSDDKRLRSRENLRRLMEVDRVYLNSELKLSDLAAKMRMTPHQLSRLLNEDYQQTFFDYINSHRIKDVKERLKDPRYASLTILGIAMECGFNSKSSFNTAFKKETGMTPSDFKR